MKEKTLKKLFLELADEFGEPKCYNYVAKHMVGLSICILEYYLDDIGEYDASNCCNNLNKLFHDEDVTKEEVRKLIKSRKVTLTLNQVMNDIKKLAVNSKDIYRKSAYYTVLCFLKDRV